MASLLSQAQVGVLDNKKYKKVPWCLLRPVAMLTQPLSPK